MSKFGNRELVGSKRFLVLTAMFSRRQGVKTLPSMHYNHILQTFLELVSEKRINYKVFLLIDTESPTDNAQQVVIDIKHRSVIKVELGLF